MSTQLRRLPVSTRHAFALGFDLAVRRDALHSLIVPLLVRAPWILALALLPPLGETDRPGATMLVSSAALLGLSVTWLAVDAMLRFRARSVFNTPVSARPAPALECYALGFSRLPWLYVTEFVRNLGMGFGFGIFVLPGILLGYRLAFATEAVVLTEPNLSRAFSHSFGLTRGRFERWLEMIIASVLTVLATLFLAALASIAMGRPTPQTLGLLGILMVAAVWPVIQYAWTFFYLRLLELEIPVVEAGPLYARAAEPTATAPSWPPAANAPRLSLVEPPRPENPPEEEHRG